MKKLAGNAVLHRPQRHRAVRCPLFRRATGIVVGSRPLQIWARIEREGALLFRASETLKSTRIQCKHISSVDLYSRLVYMRQIFREGVNMRIYLGNKGKVKAHPAHNSLFSRGSSVRQLDRAKHAAYIIKTSDKGASFHDAAADLSVSLPGLVGWGVSECLWTFMSGSGDDSAPAVSAPS